MKNVILSGAFCTGKTTHMLRLAKELGYNLVADHTTRQKRANEKEGSPYIFVTHDTFENNKKADMYFEPVFYGGNWYGYLLKALQTKSPWVIDIVGEALPGFQKAFPDTVSIYLESPESEAELVRRALARNDPEEEIAKRIKLLQAEVKEGFDYVIPGNLSLDDAYALIVTSIAKNL